MITLLAITALTILFVFYLYRKFYAHKYFEREGIPGPEPNWLLGNAGAFADKHVRHLVIPRWSQQYGKIFGYYEGSLPTLVTSDVDFVSQVFIKQFPLFHSRKQFPIQDDAEGPHASIVIARGEKWKRLRTTANPMFSSGKLRSLNPLMSKCQNDFMALIDRKAANGQEFNILPCFQFLTLDTISETAFGIELNSARSDGQKQNPILDLLRKFFSALITPPPLFILATFLNELKSPLTKLEKFRAKLPFFRNDQGVLGLQLRELMRDVIDKRKQTNLNRRDLLQMMLEVEVTDGTEKEKNGLTTDEIISQAATFMLAGYETTSNALAFTAFYLANSPDVQKKLLQEIEENFKDPKKPVEFDTVHDLKYLDCVINESLRLQPIAPVIIHRMAMEDTVINGIKIPKGLPIFADSIAIHHDDEQWGPVDTHLFHPERFTDDYPTTSSRSDAAFMPFGFGPRICVGQRFAQFEMKLTLVNLLRKYEIVKTPRLGDSIKVDAAFTVTPTDGIWVKLVQRQQ